MSSPGRARVKPGSSPALVRGSSARVRRIGRVLVGLLRELADENAYARHLAHHQVAHSPDEWRRFCEHRLRAKYTRPKCC